MNTRYALLFLLLLSSRAFAQLPEMNPELTVFTLESAREVHPDSVRCLNLEKMKLRSLPSEIYRYRNLEVLNLDKNKLDSLPDSIRVFKHLTELRASKNNLQLFPIQICALTQLKVISLSRNPIGSIPDCIRYVKKLEYLDMWDCPIRSFPEGLAELKSLKSVDVRSILFSAKFQERWVTRMPQTTFYFDPPCECLD